MSPLVKPVDYLSGDLLKKFNSAKGEEQKIHKNEIIKHILGDDCHVKYEKIIKRVNKVIAHISKNKILDEVSYDDIEGVILKIEKIICEELPRELFNESVSLPHEEIKNTIKTYLKKLFNLDFGSSD